MLWLVVVLSLNIYILEEQTQARSASHHSFYFVKVLNQGRITKDDECQYVPCEDF